MSTNKDEILWMVIRTDLHGTKFLVKDALTKAAAVRYVDDLKDAQKKVHGQDYSLLSYRRYKRAAAIEEHGIVI